MVTKTKEITRKQLEKGAKLLSLVHDTFGRSDHM